MCADTSTSGAKVGADTAVSLLTRPARTKYHTCVLSTVEKWLIKNFYPVSGSCQRSKLMAICQKLPDQRKAIDEPYNGLAHNGAAFLRREDYERIKSKYYGIN